MSFFKKTIEKNIDIKIPECIAVIMDGNGRWAKKRGLPRNAGHSAGANNFKKICRYANSIGVKCMVFYAFSTENWNRPKQEVDGIMSLFVDYLKDITSMAKENMKLRFIGDRSKLSEEIVRLMKEAEIGTAKATGMTVILAVNYGGRDEITNATRKISELVKEGKININDINENTLSEYMYDNKIPDPDLVIRPSGEVRISNFLIWQSAYSEFWFDDVLWPDFSTKDLDRAIKQFSIRDRRFGGVKN